MTASWLPSYPTSSQPIPFSSSLHPYSLRSCSCPSPLSFLFVFIGFHLWSIFRTDLPILGGQLPFYFHLISPPLSCDNLTHLCRWLTGMPWPLSSCLNFFQWTVCKYLKQTQLPNSCPSLSTVFLTSQNCTPPSPHSLDSTLQSHLWVPLFCPHLISNGAGWISLAPSLFVT